MDFAPSQFSKTRSLLKTLERVSLFGLTVCLAASLSMAAWTVSQTTLGV